MIRLIKLSYSNGLQSAAKSGVVLGTDVGSNLAFSVYDLVLTAGVTLCEVFNIEMIIRITARYLYFGFHILLHPKVHCQINKSRTDIH